MSVTNIVRAVVKPGSDYTVTSPMILNAFPTDIASGSIASFSDGADMTR